MHPRKMTRNLLYLYQLKYYIASAILLVSETATFKMTTRENRLFACASARVRLILLFKAVAGLRGGYSLYPALLRL